MLSKEQKIKLILDVKHGKITKNILGVLKIEMVIFLTKNRFCENYHVPLNEVEEVVIYINNLCGWHNIPEAIKGIKQPHTHCFNFGFQKIKSPQP